MEKTEGISRMPLPYTKGLKHVARRLRRNMTDSEKMLWSRLRGKQFLDVQFYRQKPIGDYIVDFYAPRAKIVVEVDGAQHLEATETAKDKRRDEFLGRSGLKVLRFNSREVLEQTEAVVNTILRIVNESMNKEIPLNPPFSKGEDEGGR